MGDRNTGRRHQRHEPGPERLDLMQAGIKARETDIDATYAEGRSQNWIKLKRTDDFDATVVGFTPPKGSRRGIGSLLLAVREADGDGNRISHVLIIRLRAALEDLPLDGGSLPRLNETPKPDL